MAELAEYQQWLRNGIKAGAAGDLVQIGGVFVADGHLPCNGGAGSKGLIGQAAQVGFDFCVVSDDRVKIDQQVDKSGRRLAQAFKGIGG